MLGWGVMGYYTILRASPRFREVGFVRREGVVSFRVCLRGFCLFGGGPYLIFRGTYCAGGGTVGC